MDFDTNLDVGDSETQNVSESKAARFRIAYLEICEKIAVFNLLNFICLHFRSFSLRFSFIRFHFRSMFFWIPVLSVVLLLLVLFFTFGIGLSSFWMACLSLSVVHFSLYIHLDRKRKENEGKRNENERKCRAMHLKLQFFHKSRGRRFGNDRPLIRKHFTFPNRLHRDLWKNVSFDAWLLPQISM